MIKEAFVIGDSIERALAVACSELGVEADQVEYEVIQAPEKKKFGFFGGADAKVRAYINITPSQRAAEYLKNVLTLMGLENIDLEVKDLLLRMRYHHNGDLLPHRMDKEFPDCGEELLNIG